MLYPSLFISAQLKVYGWNPERMLCLSIFAAQNTDHVLCNKSAVRTTILGDGSKVYTVEYTLMPRAEGSTIIKYVTVRQKKSIKYMIR